MRQLYVEKPKIKLRWSLPFLVATLFGVKHIVEGDWIVGVPLTALIVPYIWIANENSRYHDERSRQQGFFR